ncbi:MAG: hypothetical protein IPH57_15000 [Saprospiraceae bacterium]|nr:hypothetical protein [Saprospiraceae bacterium]
MKKSVKSGKILILVWFSVFLFINTAKTQVGVDLIVSQQKFINWNDVISDYATEEYHFLRFNYGAGINYWFRLKEYRVEFTPGIYYLYSDFKFDNPDCSYIYHSHTAGMEFDANIYPFELRKKSYEKDCPSFSTRGEYFPKSFFIQVSPGMSGSYRNITQKYIRKFDLAGKLDFGFGLDMKLSQRIIIAPIIKYGFTFANDWKGFSEFHAEESYHDKTPGHYLSLVISFYIK